MSDRIDKIDDLELVNVTGGDWVPGESRRLCRAIISDTGGEIKVRLRSFYTGEEADHILVLNTGVPLQVGNIVKVYRYLTGTTPTTSQVYNNSYALVNGVKLGY